MTVSEQARRFVKEASLFASLLALESDVVLSELVQIIVCGIVLETLKACRGNQCLAARRLGADRNTIGRWIARARKLGLEVPPLRGRGNLMRQKQAFTEGKKSVKYESARFASQSAV